MQDRFYFRYLYDNRLYDVFAVDFFNQTAQLVSLDRAETLFKKINIDKLMQCTGLKDKNGKLIYEGDIVTFEKNNSTGKLRKGVVKYYQNYCYFYVSVEENNWARLFNNIPDRQYLEVIGNIYENPELINDK